MVSVIWAIDRDDEGIRSIETLRSSLCRRIACLADYPEL